MAQYQQLNSTVDDAALFQGIDDVGDSKTSRKTLSWDFRSMLMGAILGYIVGLSVFYFAREEPRNEYAPSTSIWSPASEIFENDEPSIRRFDGALRKSNRFRGPPSQDIDNAWDEITIPHGGLVRLTQSQLIRVNASEYAAKYTKEMGGGYIAGIEVFHQLHCVNMLRKATYMDHYLPRTSEWEDQQTLRYHLDYCIDMLRQKLMCDPDMGMVTYVWAKDWQQPFPDFSTVHKCRDYSRVVEWAHKNSVHGRNVADMQRDPGALERETRP